MSGPNQFELCLAAPRRIDISIERLASLFNQATQEQRDQLVATSMWPFIDLVVALRAMERGEEEALGYPPGRPAPMADAYDRVVQPGEPIHEALVKTLKAGWR